MENKFKAGDKVKFINFDNENSSSWEKKVNKNNVYTINHVGSYMWNKDGKKPCVCISELYGGWIPESCVELYVEIPKFEIGKWYEFNSNNLQIGKCIKNEIDNIKFFPWIINKDNLCAGQGNFVPSKIQLIRELKGDDECILKFFPKIFTSLANPLFKFNIGDEIEGDKTKGHHYCTPEDFNRYYKIGGSEYIGADFTKGVIRNRKCVNGINWYTNENNWWTEDALKSVKPYDLVMGTGMALCSIGIDPYKKELTQKEKLHVKTNIKIINEDVNPIKSIQLQLKTKQKSIKF